MLAGHDDAVEDFSPLQLVPECDGVFQTIGVENGRGIGEGGGFDVGTGEVPPEFGMSEERVDAACADPDVEDPDVGAAGHLAVLFGEEIGQTVEIVCPAGNWRTEEARGEPPVPDSIMMREERLIQQADCSRVGEIDGRRLIRQHLQKGFQFRNAGYEGGKVISALMTVPGMQSGLVPGGIIRERHGDREWGGRLVRIGESRWKSGTVGAFRPVDRNARNWNGSRGCPARKLRYSGTSEAFDAVEAGA